MRAALAALALAALACSTAPPRGALSAPLVRLMRLEPGDDPARVQIELQLTNLNQGALTLEGLRFELEIDGRLFARAQSEERLELARFGEALATLEVAALRPEVVRALEAPGSVSGFDWRLRGEFRAAGGTRLPFEAAGRLLATGTSY
jgi:hypothetical protein